ncbi:MAG: hypothetical protein HZA17_11160 [Nitrospirae bacterium]|nr:hypothetical protein [Nitrospirota bacterium]
MNAILPKEEILNWIDQHVIFEEYTLKDIDRIKHINAERFFRLIMNTVQRIIEFDLYPINRADIGGCVECRDPDIYKKISRIIGDEVIKDIYYARGEVPGNGKENELVSELLAAQVYPNNLYLAAVEFAIPERSGLQGSRTGQEKATETLFCRLIGNAAGFGRSRACNYLLFSARALSQVELFERCGFMAEGPAPDRLAANPGREILMTCKL